MVVYCFLCNRDTELISVYACGHAYLHCCATEFLKFDTYCPICREPDSIFYPIEYIKVTETFVN